MALGLTLSPFLQQRADLLIDWSLAEKLERAKGFEPSTPTLARSCSTPELHPHPLVVWPKSLIGRQGRSYSQKGRLKATLAANGAIQANFCGAAVP